MILSVFNTIFNTLVRDVDPTVKIILCCAFLFLAVLSFMWSIRKKNDKYPIAWGWMVLSILSACLAIVYSIF